MSAFRPGRGALRTRVRSLHDIRFWTTTAIVAVLAGALASAAFVPVLALLVLCGVVALVARHPRNAVIALALASPFYDLAVIQVAGVADIRILEVLWAVAAVSLMWRISSGAETRFVAPPRWFTLGISALAGWFFVAALASGAGLRPLIEAVQTGYLVVIAYLVAGVVSGTTSSELLRWLRPWAVVMSLVLLLSLGGYVLGFVPVAQTIVKVPEMSVEYAANAVLVQDSGAAQVQISRLSVLNLGPVGTAAALVSILIVALAFALSDAGHKSSRLAWLVMGSGGLVLLLTYSRAGWALAIVAAALLMLAARSRKATITLSLFALVLAVFGSLPSVASRVEDFANVGEGSYQAHARMWVTAAYMISEHPVFGWGPGMYAEKANAMDINSWMATDISADQPHNWLLEISAETGGVGGVIVIALVGTILVFGWRRLKDAQLPVLAVWVATGAYVAMNLTLNAFRTEMMWVWFGAVIGFSAWQSRADVAALPEEDASCAS